MTVQEWRNRNRRCKFCRWLQYMTLPPFCMGKDTWCRAKKKIVNDEVPRIFCRLFELKEERNEG